MARTIQEIYDAMAVVKADQPELVELVPGLDSSQSLLTELTTTSRVGSGPPVQ